MASGIYAIVNMTNSKAYVGSAMDLDQRKRTHFTRLRCQKHPSKHLQAAFCKYGEDKFSFSVLEEVADANALALLAREQFWIDMLHPAYNKRLTASSNAGITATPEWRAAQSAGLKAFRATPQGAAHRQALKVRVAADWADPVKRKARVDAIKATWTPERRAEAGLIAKARVSHLSPDGVHFGTHRVWTPEERQKLSVKTKARWAERIPTEEDIRSLVAETNPKWSLVELTGVRAVDRVLIHCEAHNHDQWQTVAKLRYAHRGCRLCGFQRSSEVQAGRSKSDTVQSSHSIFQE